MDLKTLTENDVFEYIPEKKRKKGLINNIRLYGGIGKILYGCNRMANSGRYDGTAWAQSSLDILEVILHSGADLRVEGINNIKQDDPVVYVSNHMSTLETFIMPSIIYPNNKVCFIMKKELVDMPLFGPVCGVRHPIVVGRKNPREDLMEVFKQSKQRIDEGRSIIVFPQKSRSSMLDEKAFNTIGVKIANKYKVKIVPVALVTDFWQNGKLIKDFGSIDPSKKVRMSFGEPFVPSGDGAKDNQVVIDFIKERFISWGMEDKIKKY